MVILLEVNMVSKVGNLIDLCFFNLLYDWFVIFIFFNVVFSVIVFGGNLIILLFIYKVCFLRLRVFNIFIVFLVIFDVLVGLLVYLMYIVLIVKNLWF